MHEKLVGKEKERYIIRLFGAIAPKYDLLNNVISMGKHKRWRRLAVSMSGLVTGGKAIDVATGTGDFALELSHAAGENGYIIGTDFCIPMLDLASRKLQGQPGIELVTANAESLPFASDLFDCATIGFALRNVADVRATIAEMVRVTKPGGRVISLEIVGPQSKALQPLWRFYFHKIMPLIAQSIGAERKHYEYLPDSVAHFYSREELADIFRNCGLCDLQIRNLTFGIVCIHMGIKR